MVSIFPLNEILHCLTHENNMERDYTNGELGLLIWELCTKVEDGFKGVHERQDKTNWNVIKNTEFRLKAVWILTTLKFLVWVLWLWNILLILKTFL